MTSTTSADKYGSELIFGCINACRLKWRLQYPEFYETLSDFDILCVTETKLDHIDIITIPGYGFLSQESKQNFTRSSGGMAIIFKTSFEGKLKIIPTGSDYIMWLRLDKSLLSTEEDRVFRILYIPPVQSRFLNEDEYFRLETEITSMCSASSYICLTGDMNARTSQLCDFIIADKTIADIMNFDQETLEFFNKSGISR